MFTHMVWLIPQATEVLFGHGAKSVLDGDYRIQSGLP